MQIKNRRTLKRTKSQFNKKINRILTRNRLSRKARQRRKIYNKSRKLRGGFLGLGKPSFDPNVNVNPNLVVKIKQLDTAIQYYNKAKGDYTQARNKLASDRTQIRSVKTHKDEMNRKKDELTKINTDLRKLFKEIKNTSLFNK